MNALASRVRDSVRSSAPAPRRPSRGGARVGRLPLLLLVAVLALAGVACEPAPDPAGVQGGTASGPPLRSLGRFTVLCYALSGTTASGRPVSDEVVAVDPRVIPLGTRLFIEGIGWRTALDTGGAIKGRMLDVWKPTVAQCRQHGRQTLEVFVPA